jgi:hypothetical protein
LLNEDSLKHLTPKSEFTRLDKLLFCLAVDVDRAKQVKEIREIAQTGGLRTKTWNISQILGNSRGLAIRTPAGWELSPDGRAHVARIAGSLVLGPPPKVAANLRRHLANVSDPLTESFVTEAITCYEMGLHRAAVVLSWAGAVSILQEYIIQNKLAEFNAEARRRDARWKDAKKRDDLSQMKEFDFLQILAGISVIGKSVKQELEKRLQLRNACGHPNALRISDHTVAAHIEILILNIFSQFST